jgi:hypothetical protein
MRRSSSLAAAAFVLSLATGASAMAADFSGIAQSAPQQQALAPQAAQVPADPPALQQLRPVQTGPYDSRDFAVPPYEINP